MIAALFVLLRLVIVADGDITVFVTAGDFFVSPEANVTIQAGAGYDGQFVYRTALAPYDLDLADRGVRYDSPLRLQRLTYPLLAFAAALGQAEAVPYTLVAVNVAALAVLVLLGAKVALASGRPAYAGLLLASPTGIWISLGRDLTEIVTATLLVAGLVAWRNGQRNLAILAFTAAVLSRETALLIYGVFIAAESAAMLLSGRKPGIRLLLAAAVPVSAFAAWQAVCWSVVGQAPLLASSGANAVWPGTALAPRVLTWAQGAAGFDVVAIITLGQSLALAILVVAGGLALRGAAHGERLAWLAALVLVVSLSDSVWKGPADFRTATELHVLSALLLLRSPHRLITPAAVVGVASLFTLVTRVLKA